MINGFKAHTVCRAYYYTTFEGNMYDMVLYYSTYTYLRKLFTTKYVMVLGNYTLLVAVR